MNLPRTATVAFPLSWVQEKRLLIEELERPSALESSAQCGLVAFQITGGVVSTTLEVALNEIVRRHEALRSTVFPSPSISLLERKSRLMAFASTGAFAPGLYQQMALPAAKIPLNVIPVEENAAEETIARVLNAELSTPFKYSAAPLLRGHLLRLSPTQHLLILVFWQMLMDSWSLRIIERELIMLYGIFSHSCFSTMPAPQFHFRDFVISQHAQARSGRFDPIISLRRQQKPSLEESQIWRGNMPWTEKASRESAGGLEGISLSEVLVERVLALAAELSTTVQVVVLTALYLVLYIYTRKLSIAIWVNFPNRDLSRFTHTIGFFVSSHLMAVEMSPRLTAKEVVNVVHAAVAQVRQYQHVPSAFLWQNVPLKLSDLSIRFNAIDESPPDDQTSAAPSLSISRANLPYLSGYRSDPGLQVVMIVKRSGIALKVYHSAGLPIAESQHFLADIVSVVDAMTGEPGIELSHLTRTS